mmetsp:Transcript_63968/g.169326  ORF Transcript_63968/g.169326 Transcript_63968/m.169326 type:complete len:228 (-) Transcript_63968:217-900(-)
MATDTGPSATACINCSSSFLGSSSNPVIWIICGSREGAHSPLKALASCTPPCAAKKRSALLIGLPETSPVHATSSATLKLRRLPCAMADLLSRTSAVEVAQQLACKPEFFTGVTIPRSVQSTESTARGFFELWSSCPEAARDPCASVASNATCSVPLASLPVSKPPGQKPTRSPNCLSVMWVKGPTASSKPTASLLTALMNSRLSFQEKNTAFCSAVVSFIILGFCT